MSDPLPPDDFEDMFGAVLDHLSEIFVVKDPDDPSSSSSQQQQSINDEGKEESQADDIDQVMLVERRSKEWRNRTKEIVDHAREQLRGIALDYKTSLQASQRSTTAISAQDHQRQLETMFQQTMKTMRLNSELDQQVMELQGELVRLNQELKQEEEEAIQVGGLNSDVLKLKLYRDLGFTPLADESGKFTKMIVRSAHSQEARTVELDSQVNDFQWANFLWGVVDGRVPPGTNST
ncbi:hypothetical protein JCM3765_002843 [Sporobolomyces pararoseus]